MKKPMGSRAAALALSLLLLATAAVATPAVCCPAGVPAQQTIGSVDCCAAMLECPTLLQAALTAPVPGAVAAPPAGPLSDYSILPSPHFRWAAATLAPAPPGSGVLLYRLHSQLLI